MFLTSVFGRWCVVGVGGVFLRVLLVGTRVMRVLFRAFRAGGSVRRRGCLNGRRIGQGHRCQRLAGENIAMLVMKMIMLIMRVVMVMRRLIVVMIVRMRVVVMMMPCIVMVFGICVMFGVVRATGFGVQAFDRRAFGMQAFDMVLALMSYR